MCHAGATQHLLLQERPSLQLAPFWADHKAFLPIHYAVYLAEVGCKKSAAANVESIFSGAGKFTAEAPSTGAELLSCTTTGSNSSFAPPCCRSLSATISSFSTSPARAAPVDANENAPTAAHGCRGRQGALKTPTAA